MATPSSTDLIPVEIPEAIKKRYEESGRHYHNLDHVSHMLKMIPASHPHARELVYATWFHDCVYDPKAPHGANEKESIRLWETFVEEQGERLKDVKDMVSLMIHCTITHSLPQTHSSLSETQRELVKRFLDMDMDILASPRGQYFEYAGKVRQEYSHLGDEEFRIGRINFLESEVKKEMVFHLKENEEQNGVALENMMAEAEMLKSAGRESVT